MDELKNIAPKLSEIKKENPFGVPPHYFDDFSARLQMKIEAEKTILRKPESRIIQFLKPALGLAAGIAIALLLIYSPSKIYKNGKFADNINQSAELTDNNFISLLEWLDDDSFYALLGEAIANDDDYNDDDFISYLSSNMSDYDILYELYGN